MLWLTIYSSLLIGTIINTLGNVLHIPFFNQAGSFAMSITGAAMAVSIGYALQAPPFVLFSLAAVGQAANQLGGAGGPLAVFFIAVIAGLSGMLVSKRTRIDLIVTPFVTVVVGVSAAIFSPAHRCLRFCWKYHYLGDRNEAIHTGILVSLSWVSFSRCPLAPQHWLLLGLIGLARSCIWLLPT